MPLISLQQHPYVIPVYVNGKTNHQRDCVMNFPLEAGEVKELKLWNQTPWGFNPLLPLLYHVSQSSFYCHSLADQMIQKRKSIKNEEKREGRKFHNVAILSLFLEKTSVQITYEFYIQSGIHFQLCSANSFKEELLLIKTIRKRLK